MSKLSSLKVACLGAGYFSQFHLDSWHRINSVELVGVCDQDIEKARNTGIAAFDRLEHMLAETTPDVLDIIVPPTEHATAIRGAIAFGVAQIICQKPFCLNLHEAAAILEEANVAGSAIVVHENFRFQPWYRTIKASMIAGDIGEVLQTTFRLRPGDGQGPNAYLDRQAYFQKMPRFLVHETAVHFIDTFRFLLGDPSSVYADLRQVNPVISGEDAGYILFEYANGTRGMFDGNRHLDHASDNTRRTMGEALIEGNLGTLNLLGDGSVHHRRFGTTSSEEILPPDTRPGFGGDCVHALQTHVVSHLTTGTEIENRAQDYLRVLEIEEAVYASSEQGRKIMLGGSDTR
ncbi:MAG: Gfo/Idh/MocA family oxidoreductase [Pseudomonadota bacterium]